MSRLYPPVLYWGVSPILPGGSASPQGCGIRGESGFSRSPKMTGALALPAKASSRSCGIPQASSGSCLISPCANAGLTAIRLRPLLERLARRYASLLLHLPSALFGSPAASKEARGFATPPRDGFAFLAERFPEERCACVTTNHYDYKHKHASRIGGEKAARSLAPTESR